MLQKKKLKYFLTENSANRVYLTGFTGSTGWVLIGEKDQYLFVDSRYTELAASQSPHFQIIEIDKPFTVFWKEFAQNLKIDRIGFESHNLTHQQVLQFRGRTNMLGTTYKMVQTTNLIEQLRSVKDEHEIEQISKSVEVADQAFAQLLHLLKPGQTEIEIAWILEKLMRQFGAEKIAWHPLIIATGPNSSMPHYVPGRVKTKHKDMVLLDFGAVVNGYHSDITRMIFLGKPTDEQRRVYTTVLEAQEKAIKQILPRSKSQDIDTAARKIIENQNYVPYQHGLSHGIGLEVHELPRVSQKTQDVLEEGNVISVEPGIYIPGWGGVRIEDLVVVRAGGVEILTRSPKDLDALVV